MLIFFKILAALIAISVVASFTIAPALSRRLYNINFPRDDDQRRLAGIGEIESLRHIEIGLRRRPARCLVSCRRGHVGSVALAIRLAQRASERVQDELPRFHFGPG